MKFPRIGSRLIVALGCLAPLAAAAVKYEVDRAKVYFGNADAFAKPSVAKSLTVFQSIKAYKTIEEEGLSPDTARYYLLLKEANEVFRSALTLVAKAEGRDLIAETGAVKSDDEKVVVPDLTEKLVKAVEGK